MGCVEEWVDRSEGLPVLLVGTEEENIGAFSVCVLTEREVGKGECPSSGTGGANEFAARLIHIFYSW